MENKKLTTEKNPGLEENQVHKITKEKHPGRVASGKRLSEWNQQNKTKLKLETTSTLPSSSTSTLPSTLTSTLSSTLSSTSTSSFKSPLIIFGVLALAVGGYYLWQKKPQQNVSESKPKTQEIFNPFQGI